MSVVELDRDLAMARESDLESAVGEAKRQKELESDLRLDRDLAMALESVQESAVGRRSDKWVWSRFWSWIVTWRWL